MTDDRYRLSAHVLLDAVTAMDHEQGDTEANTNAIKLALARLQDVEGITILRDDEDGATTIDARPVLGAATAMLTLLIRSIADSRDVDPDAVAAAVREQMDAIYSTD